MTSNISRPEHCRITNGGVNESDKATRFFTEPTMNWQNGILIFHLNWGGLTTQLSDHLSQAHPKTARQKREIN